MGVRFHPNGRRLMDKNLLILDLDETLLYGTERPLDREPDVLASGYFVYFRPGLETFIRHVASLYSLAVWTSASRGYALEICSRIFADVQLEFMWASERCTIQWDYQTGTVCGAKRLHKVRKKGYPLERVIVVDDSPEKHIKNYGNLVRVLPFEGDPSDRELELLSPYLATLATCTNVRKVEKRDWRRSATLPNDPLL
jgi:RNA polymerase II subunit A small phosphatase-like protein